MNSRTKKQHDPYRNLENGLIAVTAVILLSTGMMAYLVVTFGAAVLYADSVERHEWRIQRNLNQKACEDTAEIVRAKDYFLGGSVKLGDFDCEVN